MNDERYTLNLGKVAARGKRKINAVELVLELRQQKEGVEVSICGNVWNNIRTDLVSGGQNTEAIRGFFPHSKRVQRICELWDRWHLNQMNAGTPAQTTAINAWRAEGHAYDYTKACDHLAAIGLLYDDMYKYGSAWLTEEVPAEVLTELRALFTRTPKKEA